MVGEIAEGRPEAARNRGYDRGGPGVRGGGGRGRRFSLVGVDSAQLLHDQPKPRAPCTRLPATTLHHSCEALREGFDSGRHCARRVYSWCPAPCRQVPVVWVATRVFPSAAGEPPRFFRQHRHALMCENITENHTQRRGHEQNTSETTGVTRTSSRACVHTKRHTPPKPKAWRAMEHDFPSPVLAQRHQQHLTHLHHGRVRASSETLHLQQREHAVRRCT